MRNSWQQVNVMGVGKDPGAAMAPPSCSKGLLTIVKQISIKIVWNFLLALPLYYFHSLVKTSTDLQPIRIFWRCLFHLPIVISVCWDF